MEKNRHHQAFETTTAMRKSCTSIFPISALCANVCILPKALIMPKWNQDYSLTTSSKRHLGLWISKVKAQAFGDLVGINVSPCWVCRSLIGATGGVTALWFAAECCHSPCCGVPGFSLLMTLSHSANTTRHLEVVARYWSRRVPMGRKERQVENFLSRHSAIKQMAW